VSRALLPDQFAALEPWVADWSIPHEAGRFNKRVATPPRELDRFVAAVFPRIEEIVALLERSEALQAKKVLELARRLVPHLTAEDIRNPHDFPDLEDPDWHFEDGQLAGIQGILTSVRALHRAPAVAAGATTTLASGDVVQLANAPDVVSITSVRPVLFAGTAATTVVFDQANVSTGAITFAAGSGTIAAITSSGSFTTTGATDLTASRAAEA
jgi:hypothetical protein